MKGLLIACAVLLVLPCATLAVDYPILDTGQTKCYDDVGNELNPYPQPGEDFYGQDANYAPCNPHSYTKLDAEGNDLPDTVTEWVMVRDNVTGLIWEVKQNKDDMKNYANPHDADNRYTWYDSNPDTNGGDPGVPGDGTDTEDFIIALNTAQFGGHNDWRIPTIKELSSIVDSNIPSPGPTIDTNYFPNTPNTVWADYWSSTTYAINPDYAWEVNFNGLVYDDNKFFNLFVRAVRGEQHGSSDHYADNGNGTVTDTDTGLIWQKETAPGTYTWQQALSYCESLALAGHNDWRLPNRNELQSLVDYSKYDPSIDTVYFPNTLSFPYWSSTTYVDDPYPSSAAWFVRFLSGYVGADHKVTSYYVRAVRDRRCCGEYGDSDIDGICEDGDNSGTPGDNPCTGGQIESCDDNCPSDHNPLQLDSYPPQGNGIGDACDCEADFDCNGGVDAEDIWLFLIQFGRTPYFNPCTVWNPCIGDFACDEDVDADDVGKLLEDFGRNEFNDPCPTCVVGDWCVY